MCLEPPPTGPLELSDDDAPMRECWRCGKQVVASAEQCPFCAAGSTRRAIVSGPQIAATTADSALMRLLAAYVIFLAVSVAGMLFIRTDSWLGAGRREAKPSEILVATLVLEAIDVVVVLVAIAWIRVPSTVQRPRFGKRVAVWVAFLPVLAALLAFNIVYHWILRDIAQIDMIETNFTKDARLLPGWIVAICVQPAVIEELFFRYAALGALRTVTGVHAAVILSAVMFGMIHLAVPLSIPMLIVLGIGLGYARIASGGMVLPMVLHFLHNAAILVLERALS